MQGMRRIYGTLEPRRIPNMARPGTVIRTLALALYYLTVILIPTTETTLADTKAPSPAPLRIATAVDPNVMLFIDNSASMAAIFPHPDYSPATDYPNYQVNYGSSEQTTPIRPETLIRLEDLRSADCPDSFTQARMGANVLCLKLPARHPYPKHYLDYLFSTFPTHSDLTVIDGFGNTPIPAISLFEKARIAAVQLARLFKSSDICLSAWNTTLSGVEILQPCIPASDTAVDKIDSITLQDSDSFILAEAYSNLVRYFAEGVDDTIHPAGALRSPVRYRCQQNAIIIFSDHNLAGTSANRDIHNHDMEQVVSNGFNTDLIGPDRIDDSRHSFGEPVTTDTEGSGDFSLQQVRSFAVVPERYSNGLEPVIHSGGGRIFGFHQMPSLRASLITRLTTYRPGNHSGSTAITGDPVDQSAFLYQTGVKTATWSGSLKAYSITSPRGEGYNLVVNLLWNAEERIQHHSERNIFTSGSSGNLDDEGTPTLAPFRFDQISERIPGALLSEGLVNWLRGDRSQEQASGGELPDRDSPLGAMVEGSIAIEPAIPSEPYRDPDYFLFKQQVAASSRPDVVYTGSSDGLLHAFQGGNGGGRELFAYFPGLLIDRLPWIAKEGSRGMSGMGGPITVADARIGKAETGNPWRTVLVAAPGRGARGLFALDVTNPDGFVEYGDYDPEYLLWEIGDTSRISDYPDIGHLINPVSIIRVKDENDHQRWFIASGNGVGSAHSRSLVYLIDPATGEPIQSIKLSGKSGGITSLAAVDINQDSYTDRLYGADLGGNIWRLDWDPTTFSFDSALQSGTEPIPVFTAETSTRQSPLTFPQPVTAGIEAGPAPGKGTDSATPYGVMIYFGTGKLLDGSDIPRPSPDKQDIVQSLYGVWDAGDGKTTHRNQLKELEMIEHSLGNKTVRSVSESRTENRDHENRGWVIDLPADSERAIRTPSLSYDNVQFTTLAAPSGIFDPCTSGPKKFIVEVDALTGSRQTGLLESQPIFDLNNDQKLDEADKTGQGEAPVSIELEVETSEPIAIQSTIPQGEVFSRVSIRNDGSLSRIGTPITTKRISWRRIPKPSNH